MLAAAAGNGANALPPALRNVSLSADDVLTVAVIHFSALHHEKTRLANLYRVDASGGSGGNAALGALTLNAAQQIGFKKLLLDREERCIRSQRSFETKNTFRFVSFRFVDFIFFI